MTPIEKLIAEIEELDRAATVGPWHTQSHLGGMSVHRIEETPYKRLPECEGGFTGYSDLDDAKFIARARTLLPLFGKIIKSINRTLFYGDTLEDIGGEVCDIFDRYNDKLSEAVEVLGED